MKLYFVVPFKLQVESQPPQCILILSAHIHHHLCQSHRPPPPLRSQTSSPCSRTPPDQWGKPKNNKQSTYYLIFHKHHLINTMQQKWKLGFWVMRLYQCAYTCPGTAKLNVLQKFFLRIVQNNFFPLKICRWYSIVTLIDDLLFRSLDLPQWRPSYQSSRLCWRTRTCEGKDMILSQCIGLNGTEKKKEKHVLLHLVLKCLKLTQSTCNITWIQVKKTNYVWTSYRHTWQKGQKIVSLCRMGVWEGCCDGSFLCLGTFIIKH